MGSAAVKRVAGIQRAADVTARTTLADLWPWVDSCPLHGSLRARAVYCSSLISKY